MAKGDDVRMIENRGLPERKRLREPQLRYRTKKPRLRAGKLKLDRDFLSSLNRQTTSKTSTELAPTDSNRGLAHPDTKPLSASLWNQPLQEPKVDGGGGLPPRLALPEPGLDARYTMNSGLTDADRGLRSKAPVGTRRSRLWTSRLRLHPSDISERAEGQKAPTTNALQPQHTASTHTKKLIKEACTAAGRKDLATLALAIAMEEEKTLDANTYPFGDIYPELPGKRGCQPEVPPPPGDPTVRPGCPKRVDAANFGIYKMNWYMIKQCDSAKTLVPDVNAQGAWRIAGQKINDDPRLATQILLEAMDKWSTDEPDPTDPQPLNFWAGHRGGGSALYDWIGTDWPDILDYYRSIQTIKEAAENDKNVWKSDTRYGLPVPQK